MEEKPDRSLHWLGRNTQGILRDLDITDVVVECPYATHAFPTGCIVMWGGHLADIPEGWRLCDGTGGTPDLRDRFVKGAVAGAEPGKIGEHGPDHGTGRTYSLAFLQRIA